MQKTLVKTFLKFETLKKVEFKKRLKHDNKKNFSIVNVK